MTKAYRDLLSEDKWNSLILMLKDLRASDGEIYFIIDEKSYLGWDSYNLQIEHEKGETVESVESKFDPYFSLITKWNFVITGVIGSRGRIGFTPLCQNSYGKALAIRFGHNYYLPKPSKHSVQEGIEILLRDVLKVQPEKTEAPEWISRISISGESKIVESIETLNGKINSLKEEKNQFLKKLEENKELKSILYETGDHLENALTKVFRALNINAENTSDQRKADLLINTEEGETVLVEAKGTKGGLARSHLRQLYDWVTEYWEEHGIEPKGLMLINPFRLDPPNERKDYYPDDCIKFAESKNICLMTTMDLFRILEDSSDGKITSVEMEKRILKTRGIWLYDISDGIQTSNYLRKE